MDKRIFIARIGEYSISFDFAFQARDCRDAEKSYLQHKCDYFKPSTRVIATLILLGWGRRKICKHTMPHITEYQHRHFIKTMPCFKKFVKYYKKKLTVENKNMKNDMLTLSNYRII
jgi:hypothetical protein